MEPARLCCGGRRISGYSDKVDPSYRPDLAIEVDYDSAAPAGAARRGAEEQEVAE